MPQVWKPVLATQAWYVFVPLANTCTSILTFLETERRQNSSDSLEQQQRQPKQSRIDFEQLPQRFRKLMLSATELTPRGIAVENMLPRFCPERVFYSGCRPFLEG